jgi:lipid A disaccharide synthetase
MPSQHTQVRFSGVGGTAMKVEGLEEVFPMSDLSVMGLLEVVPYIPRLLWRLKEAEIAIVSSTRIVGEGDGEREIVSV